MPEIVLLRDRRRKRLTQIAVYALSTEICHRVVVSQADLQRILTVLVLIPVVKLEFRIAAKVQKALVVVAQLE